MGNRTRIGRLGWVAALCKYWRHHAHHTQRGRPKLPSIAVSCACKTVSAPQPQPQFAGVIRNENTSGERRGTKQRKNCREIKSIGPRFRCRIRTAFSLLTTTSPKCRHVQRAPQRSGRSIDTPGALPTTTTSVCSALFARKIGRESTDKTLV